MKAAAILAASAAIAIAAATPAPTVQLVAKTYPKALTRVTDKPRVIGSEFLTYCRPVSPEEQREKHGPHSKHAVHYYRNDAAMQPGAKFAEGAIIVKEKLSTPPGEAPKVLAAAGMIKRATGSLPKTGDWEFFWLENGRLTTEGMQGCAGCHSGAKRDYVFSDPQKPAE